MVLRILCLQPKENGLFNENLVKTLRCPLCLGGLVSNDSSFTCDACKKRFAVHFGIPDFRLFAPNIVGYMKQEEDLRLAAELFDLCDKLSFEELVRIRIDRISSGLNHALQDSWVRFRLESLVRAKNLALWIQKQAFFSPNYEDKMSLGLDIGCGEGMGVGALLEVAHAAMGIDVLISKLVLAKKFLETYYQGRSYLLVAGVAEHLPLSNDIFSMVTARDVIEHVKNQERFMREAYRVMNRKGFFSQTHKAVLCGLNLTSCYQV